MVNAFLKKFPTLAFRRNDFKSLITFNADQPFAYLGKSLMRSIGGIIRDIANNEGHMGDMYKTVAKGEKDPFEVFDYIADLIKKTKADASFFSPVGKFSKHKKNPSGKNE